MDEHASYLLDQVALGVFEIFKMTWLVTQRNKAESAYDLTDSEFLTLDALEHHQCLTVGELQRHIHVLPAQMSRIIKSLETKYDDPLITCSINSEDKRKIDVRPTSLGLDAAGAFRHKEVRLTRDALTKLSKTDLEELARIVGVLRRAAEG